MNETPVINPENGNPVKEAIFSLFILFTIVIIILVMSSHSSQKRWEEVSTAVHYAIENDYTLLIDGVPVDLETLDFSSMPNIYSVKYINDETETVYLRRNVRGGIY